MLQRQLSFEELSGMLAAGASVDRRPAVLDARLRWRPMPDVVMRTGTERRKAERVIFQQLLAGLPTTDEHRKPGLTDTPGRMG
jgi:hypothetical protein